MPRPGKPIHAHDGEEVVSLPNFITANAFPIKIRITWKTNMSKTGGGAENSCLT